VEGFGDTKSAMQGPMMGAFGGGGEVVRFNNMITLKQTPTNDLKSSFNVNDLPFFTFKLGNKIVRNFKDE